MKMAKKEDATKRNQKAIGYARALIETALAVPSTEAPQAAWEGLPRRAPEELDAHLASFTVFPYDRDLCRWWAAVSAEARRAGRPIQCADAWIAATALLYGVPLVTHNPNDYAGVSSLVLISEASP